MRRLIFLAMIIALFTVSLYSMSMSSGTAVTVSGYVINDGFPYRNVEVTFAFSLAPSIIIPGPPPIIWGEEINTLTDNRGFYSFTYDVPQGKTLQRGRVGLKKYNLFKPVAGTNSTVNFIIQSVVTPIDPPILPLSSEDGLE